ncbi:MAG: acyl-CoA/acyl-ACP dehydrogenase [Gammaproteobacteria bacterium]|nr:acyl-CoA/acyl-ACP dehydrogenase [Gammaproteobacteria bacterium]
MNATLKMSTETTLNWKQLSAELGAGFATEAANHDADNQFVHRNYAQLRDNGFFKMAIPIDLGGGGASFAEASDVIRELGQHCGSTALSFAMHTHPIAVNVFKHLRGDEKATATLQKIADNDLIIANTGANDWLASSGEMTRVDGGFEVSARKHFVSGSPGAQVFVTSANYEGENGTEVLHFAIPFNSEGITQHSNWDTMGMRATGSNDVSLEKVFVPDAAIIVRRPAGEWHPMWNAILPTAMPLIMAAYVGLADAAVELARQTAAKRPDELAPVLGEVLNQHTLATLTHRDMIRINDNHGFTPSNEIAGDILARKTLVATAVQKTVELAAEIIGGPGFFKGHPIERIQRDIKACHFHPLPFRRQYRLTGRISLGLDPTK